MSVAQTRRLLFYLFPASDQLVLKPLLLHLESLVVVDELDRGDLTLEQLHAVLRFLLH